MWLPGQSLQQQFCGEQLAYIAALAVNAALVFGDRPKELTYQRLMTLPSLADLDRSFGAQVTSSFIRCEETRKCRISQCSNEESRLQSSQAVI